MYWLVLCSVDDTRNIFLWHSFSNASMRFVMFLFRVQLINCCIICKNQFYKSLNVTSYLILCHSRASHTSTSPGGSGGTSQPANEKTAANVCESDGRTPETGGDGGR